ncbi:hypothetical protein P154DRAFT_625798 [Amniculicola lignicola CBS 123094]|uniref:Uncharacterized protein n=1 Tax=Amniculicola lignicola CBS 123094 TaxID=1392246 RepID=A0A6A5W143_9PLEO|nr:hypothetical protein P154DRAFT_625798 [Amniculicola lignicola CBS 123094]
MTFWGWRLPGDATYIDRRTSARKSRVHVPPVTLIVIASRRIAKVEKGQASADSRLTAHHDRSPLLPWTSLQACAFPAVQTHSCSQRLSVSNPQPPTSILHTPSRRRFRTPRCVVENNRGSHVRRRAVGAQLASHRLISDGVREIEGPDAMRLCVALNCSLPQLISTQTSRIQRTPTGTPWYPDATDIYPVDSPSSKPSPQAVRRWGCTHKNRCVNNERGRCFGKSDWGSVRWRVSDNTPTLQRSLSRCRTLLMLQPLQPSGFNTGLGVPNGYLEPYRSARGQKQLAPA